MSSYSAFDMFNECEAQTIIIVYKDEMLLNQVKKLIEGKTIVDSTSRVKIVSWTEKVWLAQKKEGTIDNKVLFLGDIKGTSALIPVVDVKFEKHGVRYGWAGKQAVLYVNPKEINKFEDYEAFWTELNDLPVPDVIKCGNKPKTTVGSTDDGVSNVAVENIFPGGKKNNILFKAKDFAVKKADIIGKNLQKAAVVASRTSQDMFRNKTLVKQQMLFYGAIMLCESDLDNFMRS